MFIRDGLISIKLKSLRKRVWFKALDKSERALINLTIRVVDVVRSGRLAKVLSNAVGKLKEATKSLLEKAGELGRSLAEKFSKVAQAWGNLGARSWAKDEFYAIYLGLSVLNKPVGLYQ